MKRKLFMIASLAILSGCAAVQSIVRSTFPYTATIQIPSSGKANTTLSATSQAGSFDQVFTGQGSNTTAIKDIRMASARIDATTPTGQSMSAFKSIKLYILRGDSESGTMVASRDDIGPAIGSSIMLDIDNSKILDDFIKGSTVRVRVEYVLRNEISSDITLRTSIGLSVAPDTAR